MTTILGEQLIRAHSEVVVISNHAVSKHVKTGAIIEMVVKEMGLYPFSNQPDYEQYVSELRDTITRTVDEFQIALVEAIRDTIAEHNGE